MNKTKTLIKNNPKLEKFDIGFISNIISNFSKLSGTQNTTVANIIIYNEDLESVEDYVEKINCCFNYSGSKSSTDYKKLMFGEIGYNKWNDEYNKNRKKSKSENIQNDDYIDKLYSKTISNLPGISKDVTFITRLIKPYLPLNEMNRDIIIRVLTLDRFEKIEEFEENISKLIHFNGTRSNNNREYGILLLGETAYIEYMNKSISSMKDTKCKLFKNKSNEERFYKSAITLINKYELDIEPEIMVEIIESIEEYELNNELHRRWLCQLIKFKNYDNINSYSENFNNLINYTGTRSGYEWDKLRYGEFTANEKRTKKSLLFSNKNNPAYNHGGLYSKFSKKFIYGYDDEWNKRFSKAHSLSQKNNKNNPFLRDYYDSEEEYFKFQSKTLKYYIDKYGYEKGFEKYKLKEILKQISFHSEYIKNEYNDKLVNETNCVFYIIRIDEYHIKFGITTRDIAQRYTRLNYDYVITLYNSNILECMSIEVNFKKIFMNEIISKEEKILSFGYTETLKNVSDEKVLDVLFNMKNKKEA